MSKKILMGVLLIALLAVSLSMTGCGSGLTPATVDLTGDLVLGVDPDKSISDTDADPQAVKLHSLSE